MTATSDSSLGGYYDRLVRWTAAARAFGYGGGHGALTTHRALIDPAAGGRATPTRLHDIIVSALPPLVAPRVLDAGCGLGGTLIDVTRRLAGTGVGVTLSRRQAELAARAVSRRGMDRRVSISMGSYDRPPSGPFDLILAVESLAHSEDPAASVAALAGVMAPAGVFVIVDDMPRLSAEGSAALQTFKRGWRCPVLWNRQRYRAALEGAGLEIVGDRDLSAHYLPRGRSAIDRLERFNRAARRLVPLPAWRAVMDSYLAGLALERLYGGGLMQYCLLVARKSRKGRPENRPESP